MNWSKSMRQFHRWLSIAFTLFVIGNFVVMALGMGYLASSRRGTRAAQLGD